MTPSFESFCRSGEEELCKWHGESLDVFSSRVSVSPSPFQVTTCFDAGIPVNKHSVICNRRCNFSLYLIKKLCGLATHIVQIWQNRCPSQMFYFSNQISTIKTGDIILEVWVTHVGGEYYRQDWKKIANHLVVCVCAQVCVIGSICLCSSKCRSVESWVCVGLRVWCSMCVGVWERWALDNRSR